jgi:hypothetical protein
MLSRQQILLPVALETRGSEVSIVISIAKEIGNALLALDWLAHIHSLVCVPSDNPHGYAPWTRFM